MTNRKRKTMHLSDDFIHDMTLALTEGYSVRVPHFGIFELVKVPSRPGRDPVTGEIRQFGAYNKIKFRATNSVKENVQ